MTQNLATQTNKFVPPPRQALILDEALLFQTTVMSHWQRETKAYSPDTFSLAEGAAQLIHLQAKQAKSYLELLPPQGYDGRDAPMRLVAGALLFGHSTPAEVGTGFSQMLSRGGDVDVVFPLLGAIIGMRHGIDGLPLGWLNPLRTRSFMETRVRSLLAVQPQYVGPLFDHEIRFSRWGDGSKEDSGVPPGAAMRTQLSLFDVTQEK